MAIALLRLLAQPTPERAAEVRRRAPSVDMPRLLNLLATQKLVPSLGGLLLREDVRPELSDDVVQSIQAARLRARQRGLLNHGLTKRLTLALADQGIRAVPLKGATLAEAVYGDIGARLSSDIDLLVAVSGLDKAVEVAEREGWREPEPFKPQGLPRLHRELFHESLPPVELHWRVHWYDDAFAAAALDRAQPTGDGLLRLQPADELACLLLFLARDGFAGLRQTVDVAAWWAALGGAAAAAGIRAIAAAHPELDRALAAAARLVEDMADIPHGALAGHAQLSRRQRAALRLANPWLAGSRQQVQADVSFMDGLLAPPDGTRAFVGRQLLPPQSTLVRRQPRLQGASPARLGVARLGHAGRLLGRYVLSVRAAFAKPRAT
jgi:hypothetical protein